MGRNIDELNYLTDLENPENDDFVPADYNTQDMRKINEKVNRILYGESKENSNLENREDTKVNINSKNSNSNQTVKTEPENKESLIDKEFEDYVDINSENDRDTQEQDKKSTKKKVIVGSVVAIAVLLCVAMVMVIQAIVVPNDSLLARMGLIEKENTPLVIENSDGDFIFAEGCSVSGVDISGMTMKEAKKAVEPKEADARPDMNISISVDGEATVYNQDNFTFTYNTDEILNEEKEFCEKLFNSKDGDFETQEDDEGNDYYPEMVRNISATLNDTSVDKLVKAISKKYTVKPVNAKVSSFNPDKKDMFTYASGKKGKSINTENLFSQLMNIVKEGKETGKYDGNISVETKSTNPQVSVNFLKENMMLLAQWETYSTNNANGNQNMAVSLEACNGSIINPGEVWSFNECTGNSNDPANGYVGAGVIIDGSYTNGIGGGICQSSTTIFNAAVRSNLTIEERHNHTYPSEYAYSGFDAAIDYGNFDLKLKNDSKYQVFLSCYMTGTTLKAAFFGIKDKSYDMIDTYSKNHSITSSSYRSTSYRIYRDKNGKEIDREELPESYYSLANGHSVRTPDGGGTKYTHNIYVSDGIDMDKNEPPATTVPATTVQTQPPTQAPTQATPKPTKPVATKPKATTAPKATEPKTTVQSTKPDKKPTTGATQDTKPKSDEDDE